MKTLFAIFIFVSIQAGAQSFEPGSWSTEESLTLNGLPLPSTSAKECITPAQAKDAKGSIEKALKGQGCSLSKWAVKNSKLSAAILCKGQDIDATGTLRGDFSPKSYSLTGSAKGKYRGTLPAVADFKLSGQWLKKDCGAKAEKP